MAADDPAVAVRTIGFNTFEVILDFECTQVRVLDVLDSGAQSESELALDAFMVAAEEAFGAGGHAR